MTSNTERTHSSPGSVSIASSTTRGSSSTSSPSRSRNAASTESPLIPGTVRTSIPAVAKSGTELMLIPPDSVPSETVGIPSSGCSSASSEKSSSRATARASL